MAWAVIRVISVLSGKDRVVGCDTFAIFAVACDARRSLRLAKLCVPVRQCQSGAKQCAKGRGTDHCLHCDCPPRLSKKAAMS